MITLNCKPSNSLNWNLNIIPEDGQILWRFDLGLEDPSFPLDDQMHFAALKMALEKFSNVVWPLFEKRTKGAVIYRGSADFSSHFLWTQNQRENLALWLNKREPTPHLLRLFAADAYVHYFQMLSFHLPDELPIYLFLNAAIEGSLAEKHQLLSKERFEHFHIAVKNLPFTSSLLWDGQDRIYLSDKPPRALCFPLEKMCTNEVLNALEKKFSEIQKPFRVIPEAFLNEDFEGVDELYVLKDTISKHGARKIKGFEAAGGKVSG